MQDMGKLTLTILLANAADDKLMKIGFDISCKLSPQETMYLHEVKKHTFLEIYFKIASVEFLQSMLSVNVKHYCNVNVSSA